MIGYEKINELKKLSDKLIKEIGERRDKLREIHSGIQAVLDSVNEAEETYHVAAELMKESQREFEACTDALSEYL